ncbi:hypothetical protein [Chitinibacter sp. GC72]|uniref:hypothetical protein n=1 Tax=Chitinibacter sp. GC72 TaxID=1526917 RepID=UPI0012F99708|nr:hypothetical protein [Chitinibacter sp. GC72]
MIEAVNQLKAFSAGDVVDLEFRIDTVGLNENANGFKANLHCVHDWSETLTRDQVLKGAVEYCGLTPLIIVADQREGIVMHGRALTINFDSGEFVRIRLDQGFSYWRLNTKHYPPFPFKGSVDDQVERLVNLQGNLTASGEMPTQVLSSLLIHKPI